MSLGIKRHRFLLIKESITGCLSAERRANEPEHRRAEFNPM
jgi:hypothetical protein